MVHIERVSPNKSACGHFIQSFLETCKDGESHLNSYKKCFSNLSRDLQRRW